MPARPWATVIAAGISTGNSTSVITRIPVNTVHSLSS
jgi:hypothetical protein